MTLEALLARIRSDFPFCIALDTETTLKDPRDHHDGLMVITQMTMRSAGHLKNLDMISETLLSLDRSERAVWNAQAFYSAHCLASTPGLPQVVCEAAGRVRQWFI
jgi:hypothetical protein